MKDSTASQDFEMIGKDITKLQSLIDQLEEQQEANNEEANEEAEKEKNEKIRSNLIENQTK